jgi:hypothetical protein
VLPIEAGRIYSVFVGLYMAPIGTEATEWLLHYYSIWYTTTTIYALLQLLAMSTTTAAATAATTTAMHYRVLAYLFNCGLC